MANTGSSSRRVSVRSYMVDANGALVDFAETTKVVETSDAYIKVFEEGWTVSGLPDVSYRFVMEIVRRMTFADTGQLGTEVWEERPPGGADAAGDAGVRDSAKEAEGVLSGEPIYVWPRPAGGY